MKTVVLEVRDDGCGMRDYVLERCFEPFYTKKPEGSGLGLSVCHGIVKRHGGSIQVASQPGEGTTFRIILPTPGISLEGIEPNRGSESSNEMRVLLIDDVEAVRSSIAFLLRSFGVRVDIAEGGARGIQLLREIDYDLVISDLGMAGITGHEVVQAAKAHNENMAVATMSGWSTAEVMQQFGHERKPDHVLEKPINSAAVQSLLDAVMETKDSSAG